MMTPEQYFSRLKAKLHMRMKLDEYDMKVEKIIICTNSLWL